MIHKRDLDKAAERVVAVAIGGSNVRELVLQRHAGAANIWALTGAAHGAGIDPEDASTDVLRALAAVIDLSEADDPPFDSIWTAVAHLACRQHHAALRLS